MLRRYKNCRYVKNVLFLQPRSEARTFTVFPISYIVNRTSEIEIVPWCNGSTRDFGSLGPGSSPGGTTDNKFKPLNIIDIQGFLFVIGTILGLFSTIYTFYFPFNFDKNLK